MLEEEICLTTLWNSAYNTPDCVEPTNAVLRAIGLDYNGGIISGFDISGEPNGTLGKIMGIAEFCGVSPETVRYWFAKPQTRYRRCLVLADGITPGNPKAVPPKLGTKYYSLCTRRILDLKEGGSGWTDALKPLRTRVFLAGCLAGDIRRIPIFTGKSRQATKAYPSVADCISWILETAFISVENKYRAYSWTRFRIRPYQVDGQRAWIAIIDYNDKRSSDNYEEVVTDCNGVPTGELYDMGPIGSQ